MDLAHTPGAENRLSFCQQTDLQMAVSEARGYTTCGPYTEDR